MTENVNWSNERRISGPVEVHRFTAGGQAPQRVIQGRVKANESPASKGGGAPQTRVLPGIADLERLNGYRDPCLLLLFRA